MDFINNITFFLENHIQAVQDKDGMYGDVDNCKKYKVGKS